MVDEIRIYLEGGGDQRKNKDRLREGFSRFLSDLIAAARHRRIKFKLIACGSRNQTYDAFARALIDHSDAFNILLVDSERSVATTCWTHLQTHDRWDSLGLGDEHCHLMVPMMESWFLADVDQLAAYFGRGFHCNAIPSEADVERIEKGRIESALREAARSTRKRRYDKTRDAPELLGQISSGNVRNAARHCELLFRTLASIIQ